MSLPSFREAKALVRIHPFLRGLLTASFHHMRRLSAGSVSGHRAADGTAKCPESLCPTPVLPLLESRMPTPERSLLLRLRSYGLMRQSPLTLPSFSY
jgi:hypothetical protein